MKRLLLISGGLLLAAAPALAQTDADPVADLGRSTTLLTMVAAAAG